MSPDLRISDLPTTVYLFPIDRILLLPETTLPMTVTDPRSRQALEAAEAAGGYIGVIQNRPPEDRADSRFFAVGCLARIRSHGRDDEGLHVTLEGAIRFRVRQEPTGELPRAMVSYEEFEQDLAPVEEDLAGWDLESFKAALLRVGQLQTERETTALESLSSRQLIRVLAQTVPLAAAEKQALLEAGSFRELLERLFELLALNYLTTTPDASPSKTN